MDNGGLLLSARTTARACVVPRGDYPSRTAPTCLGTGSLQLYSGGGILLAAVQRLPYNVFCWVRFCSTATVKTALNAVFFSLLVLVILCFRLAAADCAVPLSTSKVYPPEDRTNRALCPIIVAWGKTTSFEEIAHSGQIRSLSMIDSVYRSAQIYPSSIWSAWPR